MSGRISIFGLITVIICIISFIILSFVYIQLLPLE